MNIDKILLTVLGEPTPKQKLFHKASTRYVAYGGAKGGGKSHGIRQKATYLAFKHKGIKILIVRRTLAELEKNHILPMQEAYAKLPPQLRPRYTEQKKVFTFPWRSTITCNYCDTDSDVWQYQGQEYDVIFIDEATRLSDFQFRRINECVRGTNKFPKRTYLTCNPGGPGHFWVKRLFIDRIYRGNEIPENYTFIQAKVWDNLPLFENDPLYHKALAEYMAAHGLKAPNEEALQYAREHSDYVQNTLMSGTPDEIAAYRDGDWEVFSGLYFAEFSPKTHACEPFIIPRHWRRSIAIDYGLDMLAVLWVAVNEFGNAYVYREFNQKNLTISAAVQEIIRETGNEVIHEYIAPPDLWNRNRDTGRSMAEIFADNGIPLIKAGNDRVQGWLNVKEWVKLRDGKPLLLVFNWCENLIDNMMKLQYDEKKKDDVATQPHEITHAPDALRYWCSRRQLTASAIMPEIKYNFECEKPKNIDGFGEITEEYLTGGY